ncbi:MAG: acyltransferase [Deltaproteobacteria bacterium]|nr:acyltransferase [Deltaproteobacteria bacterium]
MTTAVEPTTTATAATTTHQTFTTQKTFGSLDGLRALSILAVLWHHTYDVPTGWRATDRGFLGVDLFFVISGFLIVTLLLRERDRKGVISLKGFYIRRFLRIVPVYYGLLFALTIIFLTVGKNANMAPAFFDDLPYALTYTSNWAGLTTFLAITWSLSAEEQFYILWPPLERYAKKAAVPVLWGLLIIGQLIHFGVVDGLMAELGFSKTQPEFLRQTGFTPIMLGVLLAHGLHDPTWHARLAAFLHPRGTGIVALFAIVVICTVAPADLTGWPRFSLHLVMAVLVGACVIREDHLLVPALRLPPLVRIGMLSYGIYLLHMLCRHGCKSILEKLGLTHDFWLFPVTLVVTILVAQASYTLYEARFLKLKDRFSV